MYIYIHMRVHSKCEYICPIADTESTKTTADLWKGQNRKNKSYSQDLLIRMRDSAVGSMRHKPAKKHSTLETVCTVSYVVN